MQKTEKMFTTAKKIYSKFMIKHQGALGRTHSLLILIGMKFA